MAEYDTMSKAELMRMRADIDRAIAAVADRDKRSALKAAEAAAREHGFTLAELTGAIAAPARGGAGRGRARKGDADARFRNPDDHAQTWSGRGRQPGWFKAALEAGRSREDLAAR